MNNLLTSRRTFLAVMPALVSLAGCSKPTRLSSDEQKRLQLALKRCADAQQQMKEPDKWVAQVAFKVIGDVVGVVDETTKKLPQELKTEYNTTLLDWRKKVNRLGVFPADAKESPAYFNALNDAISQSVVLLNLFLEMK